MLKKLVLLSREWIEMHYISNLQCINPIIKFPNSEHISAYIFAFVTFSEHFDVLLCLE